MEFARGVRESIACGVGSPTDPRVFGVSIDQECNLTTYVASIRGVEMEGQSSDRNALESLAGSFEAGKGHVRRVNG